MSILDAMPHKCDIRIRSRTKDTMGGAKDSFTIVSTENKCWQQKATEKEIIEFQRRGIEIHCKIYFAADPEIDERHLIIIDGDSYTVRSKAIPDSSAGLGVVYRVFAELV